VEVLKGTARNVVSEENSKKRSNRVMDGETFTRLYYYGTVQIRMSADDFWLTPLGLFLDLRSCHKQFLGIEKAGRVWSIDDVIPL